MRIWSRIAGVFVALLCLATPVLAQTPDQLALLGRARQALNGGQFDQAITAALDAKKVPSLAAAAGVVLGRAYLGRFDQHANGDDLVSAHVALNAVNAAKIGRAHV